MFEFIYGLGKNKELETIVQEIDSNIANNYKDAAQEVFVLLEQKFQELSDNGRLKDKQIAEYQHKIAAYQETWRGFSHKDQTPYWHSYK